MNDVLLLIDASNMFYRAFHATKHSRNTDKPARHRDNYLEAHVFLKQLLSGITRFSPCSVVLFWDSSQPSKFRKLIYPEYKAHRQTTADMAQQIASSRAALMDVLKAVKVLEITVNGVEADDLIAHFYIKYHEQFRIRIMSNDADLQQFPGTTVFDMAGKVVDVTSKHAQHIVMSKILCGDASDNIPGVGGIGKIGYTNKYKGRTFLDVMMEFQNNIPILEKMERNRQLCSLLSQNRKIVDRDARMKIYTALRAYAGDSFNKLRAGAYMSKYGIRQLQASIPKLKENFNATQLFCRHALSARQAEKHSITL
jgi:5'-3' exonuclease